MISTNDLSGKPGQAQASPGVMNMTSAALTSTHAVSPEFTSTTLAPVPCAGRSLVCGPSTQYGKIFLCSFLLFLMASARTVECAGEGTLQSRQ